MRFLPLNSIRSRMTVAFSGSIGVLLLVANIALISYITFDIEGDADRVLNEISLAIRHELIANQSAKIGEIMARERRIFGQRLGATIVDGNGKITQTSAVRSPPWPHKVTDNWRIITTTVGTTTVVVGMDWAKPAAELRNQTTAIVLFSLLILLVASSGAWVLVGKTLSPIGRLSQQAQTASAEALHVHLESPSNDAEVDELVRTLNGLLQRLSEANAQRGRVNAAVSHELRTPLQALSGHLELAVSRPRTVDEYRELVVEAHTQATRLLNLTRDLLVLNQLDSGHAPPREPVQLSVVCDRVLRQVNALVGERNLKLTCSTPPDIMLNAAPSHVEMVVRNLIENAVKYAEQGGEIEVSIKPDDPSLEIFNECQPVPEWLPERTFEPLYRPDSSRNSATGGNGLGLPICKAVCDLNHWPLYVMQVRGGVRARVSFTGGA